MTEDASVTQDVDKLSRANTLTPSAFRECYLPSDLLIYSTGFSEETDTPAEIPINSTYTITFKSTPCIKLDDSQHKITKAELSRCFEIIERTSRADYEASAWGWHPKRKRNEMREADMRYLLVRRRGDKDLMSPIHSGKETTSMEPWHTNIEEKETLLEITADGQERVLKPDAQQDVAPSAVRQGALEEGDNTASASDTSTAYDSSTTPILGFMSFMLTREEGQDVVYIYEIHLLEEIRRQGLAGHLFDIVERIGTITGMEKSMLTVFRSNSHAREHYTRRGYEVDECSPGPKRLRGGVVKKADYVIMSKRLNHKIGSVKLKDARFQKRRKVTEREVDH